MRNRYSDLSLQRSNIRISRATVISMLLGACFVVGLSLVWIPPQFYLGGLAVIILVGMCIRWPYAGLLVYLGLEYLRPAERYPVLSPLHLSRIVVVVVLIGWLIRRRKDGFEVWNRAPENIAVILMILVVLASVPTAFWKSKAIETALDFGRTVIVFFLIAHLVNTRRRLNGYVFVFLLLNVYLSGEQLFNYFRHTSVTEGILRVGSSSGSFLGEDGDFALALNVALPFAYFLIWSSVRPILRWLAGISVLMFIGSIVATGSRGGALGLMAVLITLALSSRKKFTSTALIVFTLMAFWLVAPSSYRERISSITGSHGSDLSAQSRLASWRAAREMFVDHPLLGVGAGNFLEVFIRDYGGGYDWSRTVHNVFYQAASELGMCGIISFLFLVGCVLMRSVKIKKRFYAAGLGGSPLASYSAALLPSCIAFLVSGSLQTPLYYPHIYLLAAVALSVNNVAQNQVRDIGGPEVRNKWHRFHSHRLVIT